MYCLKWKEIKSWMLDVCHVASPLSLDASHHATCHGCTFNHIWVMPSHVNTSCHLWLCWNDTTSYTCSTLFIIRKPGRKLQFACFIGYFQPISRGSFCVSSLVGSHFTSVHLPRKMEETRLCTPSLLLERETESNCHLIKRIHHKAIKSVRYVYRSLIFFWGF